MRYNPVFEVARGNQKGVEGESVELGSPLRGIGSLGSYFMSTCQVVGATEPS